MRAQEDGRDVFYPDHAKWINHQDNERETIGIKARIAEISPGYPWDFHHRLNLLI